MKKELLYCGARYTHNGRRCTIENTENEWVADDYVTLSVTVKYDDNGSEAEVKPDELVDNLQFFDPCESYSHGYSHCKVYGITREELENIVKTQTNWEYVFVNGQEEIDCLSFEAYRWTPDEVVALFADNANAFVFAWWHWDGDIFDATETDILICEITDCEEGDEEGCYTAEINITTPDGKRMEIAASDFTEEDIEWYANM